MIQNTTDLVMILSAIIVTIDIALILYLLLSKKKLTPEVKRLSFLVIILLPFFTVFLGNYHVFESSKTVKACSRCHVMDPFVDDMQSSSAMTLAARHFRNNWIPKEQCYACHEDYGFNGNLKAKADGYRHLMRYITDTYPEPIRFRGNFKNDNCLNCHEGTQLFVNVDYHQPLISHFEQNTVSCLNCHGRAHPTPLQRSPDQESYIERISIPAQSIEMALPEENH